MNGAFAEKRLDKRAQNGYYMHRIKQKRPLLARRHCQPAHKWQHF